MPCWGGSSFFLAEAVRWNGAAEGSPLERGGRGHPPPDNFEISSPLACEQAFSRAGWGKKGKAPPPFPFPFLAIFPQTESLFTGYKSSQTRFPPFWGRKEACAGKMLKTRKQEKFPAGFLLTFCNISSLNKPSSIQTMVSTLLLFSNNQSVTSYGFLCSYGLLYKSFKKTVK